MRKRVLVPYRHFAEAQPYAQALLLAGVEPMLVEAGAPVELTVHSGLLLTGGTDVEPGRYGEAALPQTDAPDKERDAFECALIDQFLEHDLPLLAICRGLQILNVHLGGTLIQHLDSTARHRVRTADRGLPVHPVKIESGTRLAAIAGRELWDVNSRHHQAIGRVGDALHVSARDPEDGTIEAIEIPGKRFAVAVQWHPENQAPTDPEQLKLFQSFAAAL